MPRCVSLSIALSLMSWWSVSSRSVSAADEPRPREVSARVVDVAGQPIAGAIVAGRDRFEDPYRFLGLSNEKGEFRNVLEAGAERPSGGLVVRAEGYGLVGVESRDLVIDADATKRPVVQLPQAVPIRGRLTDRSGNPVAGVRVRPCQIWKFGGHRARTISQVAESAEWVREILRAGRSLVAISRSTDVILPWVETDAEGRFEIDSVGPDCVTALFVIGEDAQAQSLLVRTDDGPALSLKSQVDEPPVTVHVPGRVEATVLPSAPVVGTVTRADTGSPVFGALVVPWRAPEFNIDFANRLMAAPTDALGRYRLIGSPLGRTRIYSEPPDGAALVALERSPELEAETEFVADFAMPQGVTLRGTVTDRSSGQPVPGRVEAFVFVDNPHLDPLKPNSLSGDRNSATVDENGRFEIQVLPGPGLIGFRAEGDHHDRYRRGGGWDQIAHHRYRENERHTMFRTEPSYANAWNHHLVTEIDPPATALVHEVDLVVGEKRIDVPLEIGRGPGRPTQVYYTNETADRGPASLVAFDYSTQKMQPGTIRFFEGEAGRVVQAYDRELQLAGWTYVHSTDKAARIDLQKSASMKGRIVRADGTPLAAGQLRIPYEYDPSKPQGLLPSQPEGGYSPMTDEEGQFQLIGLAPNLPLTIELRRVDRKANRLLDRRYLVRNFELKVGEDRDLGELVFEELPDAAKKSEE